MRSASIMDDKGERNFMAVATCCVPLILKTFLNLHIAPPFFSLRFLKTRIASSKDKARCEFMCECR